MERTGFSRGFHGMISVIYFTNENANLSATNFHVHFTGVIIFHGFFNMWSESEIFSRLSKK